MVDYRSTNTTFTLNGTATVLNQSSSAFGDGWTLQGLEQITSASGGVILDLGDGGQSLWFSGSPGVRRQLHDPAGRILHPDQDVGGYTRTLPDGTQITFDSSGNETRHVDLNGLHTTFAYNSRPARDDHRPVRQRHDVLYSGGNLQYDQGPGGAADDLHRLSGND